VLRDAINNVIEIIENAEYFLVYDRPLAEHGLTWGDLVEWWMAARRIVTGRGRVVEQGARAGDLQGGHVFDVLGGGVEPGGHPVSSGP
jgi:hypothetical protein